MKINNTILESFMNEKGQESFNDNIIWTFTDKHILY